MNSSAAGADVADALDGDIGSGGRQDGGIEGVVALARKNCVTDRPRRV